MKLRTTILALCVVVAPIQLAVPEAAPDPPDPPLDETGRDGKGSGR